MIQSLSPDSKSPATDNNKSEVTLFASELRNQPQMDGGASWQEGIAGEAFDAVMKLIMRILHEKGMLF